MYFIDVNRLLIMINNCLPSPLSPIYTIHYKQGCGNILSKSLSLANLTKYGKNGAAPSEQLGKLPNRQQVHSNSTSNLSVKFELITLVYLLQSLL